MKKLIIVCVLFCTTLVQSQDINLFLTDRHYYDFNSKMSNNTYIGLGVLVGSFALNQFVWQNEYQRKATFIIGFSTCIALNRKKKR